MRVPRLPMSRDGLSFALVVAVVIVAEAVFATVRIAPDSEPVAAEIVFDEDSELLDRLAANDEAAFRMLVERHIDRAYAIALRIVGNAADAEDVVQDTMLKIWSQRWKCSGSSGDFPFSRPWICSGFRPCFE